MLMQSMLYTEKATSNHDGKKFRLIRIWAVPLDQVSPKRQSFDIKISACFSILKFFYFALFVQPNELPGGVDGVGCSQRILEE